MTETTQPLAGIRVVEFSTMITASLATMIFAQQGADVIKVEPPGIGDPMRWLGSQKAGISGLFHNCNQAKRSITLDLKSAEDLAHARQLCLQADVVIHNYRPGVMDRLGLGSESLREEKPGLIYCAITGFGHEGPLSDRPAYDHVMQAMAGFMTLQGHPEGFAYVKTLICDKITAYTAAQAITAALFARERTGRGQHIDLSMLESCIAFLWPDGGMHLTLHGEDVAHGAPFADYYQLPLRSTDGAIAYAAMTDTHWDGRHSRQTGCPGSGLSVA
jgi:crotonobetainyl-CoA:carnitine CoA-transferase CaiB-like acyl-CoA transferase